MQEEILDLGKKINFRASYTEMGNKLIIIIPKNYHNDIRKMNKPIDVTVEELEIWYFITTASREDGII